MKVVQAIIHSCGRVVNVRTFLKNIRDKATEIIKGIEVYNVTISKIYESMYVNIGIIISLTDELTKLSKEGFGQYVDKEEMARDKVLPPRNCFCAYVKMDINNLNDTFFEMV